jgi:hypothetical protein
MTGWRVPGAPADSASLSPQQQKQFSSWWLNENYGGDFSNVVSTDGSAKLYQNEYGTWQADPTKVFDINPETGQKGQYKYMATPAYTGWMDHTAPVYGTYNYEEWDEDAGALKTVTKVEELSRNRHGLYSPYTTYIQRGPNKLGQYVKYTVNPNTGEEGEWIWLGQMGWINTLGDPQPEPADGTITFGANGEMAAPYNSARDNPNGDQYANNNQTSTAPPATTNTDTTTTTTPPANPTTDSTPPVVPRTGMLRPQQDNWLDVLNRQGASLDSWDPYLGMFTNRQNNIDWSQLGSNQVQSSFEYLAGDGLFPNMNQGRIYAELMRRLGFGG